MHVYILLVGTIKLIDACIIVYICYIICEWGVASGDAVQIEGTEILIRREWMFAKYSLLFKKILAK
jgi:hypothetical protein